MKHLASQDFTHLELLNVRFQLLASDPSSPSEAWVYWNSVAHELRVYDGSNWIGLGTPGSSITDVAIATANGFAGTSDSDPSTPTLTITTTITGLLKGNGTAISAATSGTDYAPATSGTAILKGNGSGGFSSAAAGTDYAAATTGTNGQIPVVNGSGGWGTSMTFDNDTTLAADSATRVPSQHAVKTYIDAIAQGLDFKRSVRAISTTNVTLASAVENGDSFGGVTLATGDEVGLFGQSSAAENGLYVVNASGAPTRRDDANASGEIGKGAIVYVESGTSAGQLWVCSATGATPWVPGSSTSTWTQFAGAADIVAGAGLTKTGNTLDVGAGTGITVNANDVAVDTSVVVRKSSGLIGNGASTSIAYTHNLGTKDVTYSIRDASTDEFVECDVVSTSTTQITFTFATAPASNAYRVVVHG